ncbi:CHASE4 domain-containing protein [Azotosporobacter soli]|uniref:CHASE4 domain-containing protein n=1 Tax=Azotosporobacter soli TaxID=3055040 RepID=UPI0031FE7EAB
MKVRRKTVIILGGIMLGLFLLLAGLSHELILGRFKALERENAHADMERALRILETRLEDLAGVALDNGKWDESYSFVMEPNEKYINDVVGDTSAAYRLDVWLMLDNEGRFVYGKAFAAAERREIALPDELLGKMRLADGGPLPQSGGSGVVLLPKGPLLIGYHPITHSDGQGQAAGLLVVGRYLQGALLEDFSRQLQVPVSLEMNETATLASESEERFLLREEPERLQGQIAIAALAQRGELLLKLQLPRKISRQGEQAFQYFLGGMFLVSVVAIALILWLLEQTVLRRLLTLTRQVEEIKRQEDCWKRLPEEGKDELTRLAVAVNGMLTMLEESFQRVQASNNALGNLLNNAGQGILMFGESLRVHPAYSVECLRFFPGAIAQQDVCQLLYPGQSAHEQEERAFLARAIRQIFREEDMERRDVFLSLLPEEIVLRNMTLELKYKVILRLENGSPVMVMMLILTDVTEKRQLEQQFQLEHNVLKMVIASKLNYNDLSECVQEYRQFCRRELKSVFGPGALTEKRLAELLHYIHTFKGKFAQFHLLRIVEELHHLEQRLADLRERGAGDREYQALLSGETMLTWLEDDIRVLKRFLGERFFAAAELLSVSKQELLAIEKRILQNMSKFDCQWLLPLIRKLRYKPFRDLLASYPEYVATMAERLGRPVAPMLIEGGDNLVNPQYYRAFSNTLVHVIKNALEHGLEEPLERAKSGKGEAGAIQCRIKVRDGFLLVAVSDDGRGLDLERIKERALQTGMYDATALASLDEQALTQLIFRDDFSTRQVVTSLSGRGIGLAAVKKEVDKLGGRIEVMTKWGSGTTFQFFLPLDRQDAPPQISWDAVMRPLAEAARDFWRGHVCLEQVYAENFSLTQGGLQLEEMSAFIAVKGVLQGTFILSANRLFLQSLSGGLQPEVLAGLAENETWEGLVAESANVILGNSLALFPANLKSILIDTPVTITQLRGGWLNYPHREIWSYRISSEEKLLTIHFVSLESNPIDLA